LRHVVDILNKQHRDIEDLFTRLLATPMSKPSARAALRDELTDLIERHVHDEERLVYTLGWDIANSLVLDAYAEHDLVRVAIDDLRATSPESKLFRKKARALERLVVPHFRNEEETLFPIVTRRIARPVLVGLVHELENDREAMARARSAKSGRRLWIRSPDQAWRSVMG
jgi:hemerythrin-like domain-containing protein